MDPGTTCWTLIRGASEGSDEHREAFAGLYLPVVRSYLRARWRDSPLFSEVEDVVQEVFLECFRQGGALDRVRMGGPKTSFRRFLHGIVKNLARRTEEKRFRRRERLVGSGVEAAADRRVDEESLSAIFERAWIRSILDRAVVLLSERAGGSGEAARRRFEMLQQHFFENRPLREIGQCWNTPSTRIHNEYAKARKEFFVALQDVLAFENPGDRQAMKRDLDRIRALVGPGIR